MSKVPGQGPTVRPQQPVRVRRSRTQETQTAKSAATAAQSELPAVESVFSWGEVADPTLGAEATALPEDKETAKDSEKSKGKTEGKPGARAGVPEGRPSVPKSPLKSALQTAARPALPKPPGSTSAASTGKQTALTSGRHAAFSPSSSTTGKTSRDDFQKAGMRQGAPSKLRSTSFSNLAAMTALKPQKPVAPSQLPRDAITLLKQAQDPGVLFQEDIQNEGHSEERDDPALAAAVEECIRLCFGVPGILRIGPGRNEVPEAIIVVVATHGFGRASLEQIPKNVHGFTTTLAIPFELLPLKRIQ